MKARKGFTLVELLIVMAIIAALMAILIPMAGGAMKKARATKIAVTMRNIEQAAEQWLMAELPTPDQSGKYSIAIEGSRNGNDLESKGYLNDGDYSGYSLSISESNGVITITVEYSSVEPDVGDLVVKSLSDAYSNATYDTQNKKVTISKQISKFW